MYNGGRMFCREFDQSDWDTFPGASDFENGKPIITERNGRTFVADDHGVGLYLGDDQDAKGGYFIEYPRHFKQAQADTFVKSLSSLSNKEILEIATVL